MQTFEQLNYSNIYSYLQRKILIVNKDNTISVGENHGECWIDNNLNTHLFNWNECNVYLIPKYKEQ